MRSKSLNSLLGLLFSEYFLKHRKSFFLEKIHHSCFESSYLLASEKTCSLNNILRHRRTSCDDLVTAQTPARQARTGIRAFLCLHYFTLATFLAFAFLVS